MSEFFVQSFDTFFATPSEALAGLDVGDEASPAFGDFTGDGITDLVVGSARGGLRVFPNRGTEIRTTFASPVEISIDMAGARTVPTMGDLNADGLLDLVVGRNDGTLRCFRSTGTYQLAEGGSASFVPWEDTQPNPTEGISVAAQSAPFLFDVNQDGLLDLLVGSALGDVQLFLNQGSVMQPMFDRFGTALPVSVYGPSVPMMMPAVHPISTVRVLLPMVLRPAFGETLILHAAESSPVSSIKAQVESLLAVPTSLQQLSFGIQTLSDGTRTLGLYGVTDGGIIVLILNSSQPHLQPSSLKVLMPELLQSRFGESLALVFNMSDSVSRLAALVESATGLDVDLLTFSRDAVLLTDTAATLGAYAITNGSAVSLLFSPSLSTIEVALPATLHLTIGKTITLPAAASSSVASIQAAIESLVAVPAASQQLHFGGITLSGGTFTLGSYGVTDGSTLVLSSELPTLLVVGAGDGTVHTFQVNSTDADSGAIRSGLATTATSVKHLSPELIGAHLRDTTMDGVVLRLTLPQAIDGFNTQTFMRQVQLYLDSVVSGLTSEVLSVSVASVDVTFLVRPVTAGIANDLSSLLGIAQTFACALYHPTNQTYFFEHAELSTFLQGPGLRQVLGGGAERRLPCQIAPSPPMAPSRPPALSLVPLAMLSLAENRSMLTPLLEDKNSGSAAPLVLALLLLLLGPVAICCCCLFFGGCCCCCSRQNQDTERAYVKLWVPARHTLRPEAVDPLIYRLVAVSQAMVQPTKSQHVLAERPLGLLLQLATERQAISSWQLQQGLHAPVLAAGDERTNSELAVDHHLVFPLKTTSSSAAPTHTTLREVVLYGRGWYGESVLHLLLLACDGTAQSVYRRTVEWLLQAPPAEASEHPETGLAHEDLRMLVNTRYDGRYFLGQTPLHIAAARGDLPMVELLLSRSAVVDSPSASSQLVRKRGVGSTPISFAVSAGHRSIVAYLHEQGAVQLDNPIQATIVHEPVATSIEMHMGMREQVSAVAILHAVHREWCARGEVMSEYGSRGYHSNEVEQKRRSAMSGSTLLHCAVLHNRPEIYRALVDMGASPHVRDASGKSPLLLAAMIGSEEMFAVALASVSSCEWASGGLECVRSPLNEMDSLFHHALEDDELHGGQQVIGNNGHKTVLELIACHGRHEHLRCPQV